MGFIAANTVKRDSKKRTQKSCRMLRKIPHPEPNPLTTSVAPNQASLPNPFAFVQQRTRANAPLDAHYLKRPVLRPPGPPRKHHAGISEVPTLYPTLEEISCPQVFFENIQEYEKYGMVKVVPPAELSVPGFAIDTELFTIRSRHQLVNQSLSDTEIKEEFQEALRHFHASRKRHFKIPLIHKRPLNLYLLHRSVQMRGGVNELSRRKLWQQIGRELGYSGKIMSSLSTTLRVAYQKLLQPFDEYLVDNNVPLDLIKSARLVRYRVLPEAQPKEGEFKLPCGVLITPDFGTSHRKPNHMPIISGSESERLTGKDPKWRQGRYSHLTAAEQAPSYNLKQFQLKASMFEKLYFPGGTTEQDTEEEYWRLLQSEGECLDVEYGYSMVSAGGLPKSWDDPWNVQNLSQADGSLLRYIDNDRLSKPWLDVGTLFASKAWTAEPYLSSFISYNFLGAPRTWYSLPPPHFLDMLDKISIRNNTRMATPRQLEEWGVNCYAVDQFPGELIVIFPKSWHAHFNHGFNVTESSHYMQNSWLPAGRLARGLYQQLKLRAPFPWEQLILDAASSNNLGILEGILPEIERLKASAAEYLAKFPKSAKPFSRKVCVKTNQVLCLHYVDTPEGPVEPEHAEGGELVAAYEDLGYFDVLIAAINNKLSLSRQFIEHVCACLVSQRRLAATKIEAIADSAPSLNRTQSLAAMLRAAAWAAPALDPSQSDSLLDLMAMYSKSMCVNPELERVLGLGKQYAGIVSELEQAVRIEGSADIMQVLTPLLARLKQIPLSTPLASSLDDFCRGVDWARSMVPHLAGVLMYNQVEGLLAEAARFQIPRNCEFISTLLERRQAGLDLKPTAERLAFYGGADMEQVRAVLVAANKAALDESLYARLQLFSQTFELVQHTLNPDFRQRPRFSEAAQYRAVHQQIGWAVLQCEKWYQAWGHAPQLLIQADAAQRGVECPNCVQVNLQVALQMLGQMSLLQVMPDNFEEFLRAGDALQTLYNSGRTDILHKYGFV